MNKILIANRGEIACRVIRTAERMGYRTVAVFSDADVNAPHVSLADEAVHLGGSELAESYLNIEKILAVAKKTGADGIHPGYGFLSENDAFAQAVMDAGVTWIGPSPESIRIMGNKGLAKSAVSPHNVPLVLGYAGLDQSDDRFIAEADKIGFPVMVKAEAGGGGRGMRFVTEPADLPLALASARSESLKAFSSDKLLLEKAIVNPRHIEFQVFGDTHGNVIHLGERDCSIQRRHQKVIEEAPSPALTPTLRAEMGESAVLAAKSVNYIGAGTVEFLLDSSGNYYFIEMNTRLQVEHPVTELITGLDLVEWQLRVAEGEALPLTQDQVKLTGHAIEARLYAEDDNFMPSIGKIWRYDPPSGVGIRVDDGIRSGQTITPFYDAMIGKIISYGATREEAVARLGQGMKDTIVLGVETNRSFVMNTLSHPLFEAGEATTSFVSQANFDATKKNPYLPFLASAIMYETSAKTFPVALRGLGEKTAVYCFDPANRNNEIRIDATNDGLSLESSDQSLRLSNLTLTETKLIYRQKDMQKVAHYSWGEAGVLWVQQDGESADFRDVLLDAVESADSVSSGNILAHMPGTVIRLDVVEGQTVSKGDSLLVLEAMKMEQAIQAPVDGVIAKLAVSAGEQVSPKQLLLQITQDV